VDACITIPKRHDQVKQGKVHTHSLSVAFRLINVPKIGLHPQDAAVLTGIAMGMADTRLAPDHRVGVLVCPIHAPVGTVAVLQIAPGAHARAIHEAFMLAAYRMIPSSEYSEASGFSQRAAARAAAASCMR